MSKINWRVRLHNRVFWAQIIAGTLGAVLAYFGLTGADLTTWPMLWQTLCEAVHNPYVVATVALNVFNAITDPTTEGVTDSPRALTYTAPARKDPHT